MLSALYKKFDRARFGAPPPVDSGAWQVRYGAYGDGFAEFLAQTATTDVTLLDGERVIARARGGTDPISYHRGLARLAAKANALVAQARVREPQASLAPTEEPPRANVLTALAGVARRWAVQLWRDRYAHEHWLLGYRFRSGKLHLIVPPEDRFWADPFVVHQGGDRAWLFVEELVYAEGRGVLAVMEIRSDGSWTTPVRILERPYHLSYPCVFPWDGEWWMVPETSADGNVQLYRATEFPYKWELDRVLLENIRAVDCTPFEHGGRWWMYVTAATDGRVFDELSLHHAPSPRGPWTPHRLNPLLSDIIGGRCAGRPFLRDGKLLRAAQNGSRRYGYAIQLREVVTLSEAAWEEREIANILPDWYDGLVGTHTMNVHGDVTVMDGARYIRRR